MENGSRKSKKTVAARDVVEIDDDLIAADGPFRRLATTLQGVAARRVA